MEVMLSLARRVLSAPHRGLGDQPNVPKNDLKNAQPALFSDLASCEVSEEGAYRHLSDTWTNRGLRLHPPTANASRVCGGGSLAAHLEIGRRDGNGVVRKNCTRLVSSVLRVRADLEWNVYQKTVISLLRTLAVSPPQLSSRGGVKNTGGDRRSAATNRR